MSNFLAPNGRSTVIVPAAESIAVFTQGQAQVSRTIGFPNYPDVTTLIGTVTNGQTVFGPFASGATIVVESVSAVPVFWEVGTAPIVTQGRTNIQVQVTPSVIADGGSMAFAPADLLSGLVTATPTAARNITLPTGAAMDLASEFWINDSIDWTLMTLAAFALTVLQNASGHTVVGSMATGAAAGNVARFRTRKTAADTFVTYRIS